MKEMITKKAVMKIAKVAIAITAIWLMPKNSTAQKYYYNGKGTPDSLFAWADSLGNNPTSFSLAPKATFIFGSASGGTTVHITKSVSIVGNVIDSINLIIDSGAVFTITGGKLTIRPKTDSIIVMGGLTYDTRTAATLTGKLHIFNGGTLTLTRNITNIPAAAFDTLSNLVIGDGTDSITVLPKMVSKGIYGNVTINAPAVTNSFGAKLLPNTAGTYTVMGDLNIVAGRVTNSNPWPKKVSKTLSIIGNLNVIGGTYIICDSSSSNDKTKVYGDISVKSGALFSTNNYIDTLIGRGTISVEGDVIHSGGLFGNATTSKVGGKILFSTTDTAGQAFSSIGFNNDSVAPLRLEVSGGNEVEVVSDITTNDTLVLTLGYFTVTAGNTLTLNKGSKGYSDSSYVITDAAVDSATMGSARFNNIPKNTAFTLPVGNDSTYQPVTVLSADDSTSFTITTYNGTTLDGSTLGTPITDVSNLVNSSWHITRNDAGKSPVTTSFKWNPIMEGASFAGLADKDIAVFQNSAGTILSPIATNSYNASDSAVVVLTTFGNFEIAGTNFPLPLHFTSVQASMNNLVASISWQTSNEQNLRSYAVERSTDGKTFNAVGSVTAKNKNTNSYAFTDAKISEGVNYYRIKALGNTGKINYSSIVKVANVMSASKTINIYPNPVINKTFNVELSNQSAGIYSVKVISAGGQVLASKQINHLGGNSVNTIDLSAVNAKGLCFVSITSKDVKTTKTVIIK